MTYSVEKLLCKMVSKDIKAEFLLYSSSVKKLLCKMASKDKKKLKEVEVMHRGLPS